jgi:TatD DNase family protein
MKISDICHDNVECIMYNLELKSKLNCQKLYIVNFQFYIMFDTHTHLQFKAFEGKVDEVIKSAREAGVEKIVVVGTNLETSRKAVELAEKYEGIFASVGIHPHHVFSYCHPALDAGSRKSAWIPASAGMTEGITEQLEELVKNPKVIAIGETGLDRHIYENTTYSNYQITEEFIKLQKLFFKEQIKLAIKHKKTLIIHNRQAVPELLEVLEANWDPFLENRSVFHCCEPDQRLLKFASAHNIFIGIDGDITYDKAKQEFMKQIPLSKIVLETDSPYFTPKPSRHSRAGGNSKSVSSHAPLINNEPKNLNLIADFLTILTKQPIGIVRKLSSENSAILYNLI